MAEKNQEIMEQYDTDMIMRDLRKKGEMDPDAHDGSYRMMRETVKAYGCLQDMTVIDYHDLNLVYLTSIGTWKHGIEAKKKTIDESHLRPQEKEYLKRLWDETWEKAGTGKYTNSDSTVTEMQSVGMFGTGFFSFQNKTTPEHARSFILMCLDILPMKNDNEMYDRAARVLNASFRGMQAASASMVLHCLKPFTFPILNSHMGLRNFFEILGIPLSRCYYLDAYIDNCRKIKAFRDRNFSFGNYRIFDMAAWDVKKYLVVNGSRQPECRESSDAAKEADRTENLETRVNDRVRDEFRRQIQAKKDELEELSLRSEKLRKEIDLLEEMLGKI